MKNMCHCIRHWCVPCCVLKEHFKKTTLGTPRGKDKRILAKLQWSHSSVGSSLEHSITTSSISQPECQYQCPCQSVSRYLCAVTAASERETRGARFISQESAAPNTYKKMIFSWCIDFYDLYCCVIKENPHHCVSLREKNTHTYFLATQIVFRVTFKSSVLLQCFLYL